MICTHQAAEYAKRMDCIPCEICKGHVDSRGVVLNKEYALQRFPESQAQIESNELRWHPIPIPVIAAKKSEPAPKTALIYGIAAVATLGYLLIAGFFIGILLLILFVLL